MVKASVEGTATPTERHGIHASIRKVDRQPPRHPSAVVRIAGPAIVAYCHNGMGDAGTTAQEGLGVLLPDSPRSLLRHERMTEAPAAGEKL